MWRHLLFHIFVRIINLVLADLMKSVSACAGCCCVGSGMLRYKKIRSMRKVRIFCCDPDATESSDDENDQNSKKEKKIIREVLIPVRKYKTSRPLKAIMPSRIKDLKSPERKVPLSRYRGVRLRDSGRWQAEIRNPLTKRREYSLHDTEEAAAATYQAKWFQFHSEMLPVKASEPVSEHATLSSSSLGSCASSSVLCKQNVQEAQQNGVFMEISEDELHHEPMDESLLNSSILVETSEDVMLNWKDELPFSVCFRPTDEPPLDDFIRLEAMFPVSDFIDATYEPMDDEYIGLADISHLPLQFKGPEFDLDAELDWSGFDFVSVESELELL